MENKKKAWLVFLIVYIASFLITMCQFKVPPVMQILINDLNVSLATAGLLMSIFAIAGIILAVPAAVLLQKFGPKTSGLIALGCAVLGSFIGALAGNATTLLISRIIEGVSLGLIGVVAPAVVCMWFPPEKRGLPMGIWATWVGVGIFLIYNLAGPLSGSFGWQGLWWFTGVLCLFEAVLYAIVVSAPGHEPEAERQPSQARNESYGKAFFNPGTWILAIVFLAFNIIIMTYNTWGPSYLQTSLGLSPAKASFEISLFNLISILASILCGIVLNIVKRRYLVLAGSMLVLTVMMFWSFNMPGTGMVTAYMVLLGLVIGFIISSVFTLAPETMKTAEMAGMAMAIIIIAQNVGALVGPPIVGGIVEHSGWEATIVPMVIVSAIGFVIAVFVRPYKDKDDGEIRSAVE